MKKQTFTTSQERKLKFAEAGILFALILGITIFVGARLVSRSVDEDAVPTAAAAAPGTAPVAAAVMPADDSAVTLADESAEPAAESDEPVAAVEPVEQLPITYAQAEEAYHAGDYDEAADMFSRYVIDHPANAWGHYMLGLSEWKAGDPGAAEEAFLAALALQPGHVKSLVNYGRVLIELDRAAEAESEVAAALDVDPTNLDARRVMGRVLYAQGRLDDAADSYRTVLAERPDDVWSLNNLGLIRIEQERFAEALPALAKAVQLNGDAAVIRNNLGVALERTGHPAAAAAQYTAAAEAGSGSPKAELSLARVEALAGDDTADSVDLTALAASFESVPSVAQAPAAEPAVETAAAAADSATVAIPAEFTGNDAGLEVAASLSSPAATEDAGEEQQ